MIWVGETVNPSAIKLAYRRGPQCIDLTRVATRLVRAGQVQVIDVLLRPWFAMDRLPTAVWMIMLKNILGVGLVIAGVVGGISVIGSQSADGSTRWSSVAVALLLLVVGWNLARGGRQKPVQQDTEGTHSVDAIAIVDPSSTFPDPEPTDGPSPSGEVSSVLSIASAPIRSDTLVTPAQLAPFTASKDEMKILKKNRWVFEDLKHVLGVPGLKAKGRASILLKEEGIVFIEPHGDRKQLYRLAWNVLQAVETQDTQSARDHAEGNSFMTGALATGRVGAGGIVAVGAMNALMSKHPLLLKFRAHRNDPMVSIIAFDTFDNEIIAAAILARRSALVAEGKVTFD